MFALTEYWLESLLKWFIYALNHFCLESLKTTLPWIFASQTWRTAYSISKRGKDQDRVLEWDGRCDLPADTLLLGSWEGYTLAWGRSWVSSCRRPGKQSCKRCFSLAGLKGPIRLPYLVSNNPAVGLWNHHWRRKAKAHFSYSYLIGPRRICICQVSSFSWLFLGVDLQGDSSIIEMVIFEMPWCVNNKAEQCWEEIIHFLW